MSASRREAVPAFWACPSSRPCATTSSSVCTRRVRRWRSGASGRPARGRCSSRCSPSPAVTASSACPTASSVSRAAGSGTSGHASASSGCSWGGGRSSSPPAARQPGGGSPPSQDLLSPDHGSPQPQAGRDSRVASGGRAGAARSASRACGPSPPRALRGSPAGSVGRLPARRADHLRGHRPDGRRLRHEVVPAHGRRVRAGGARGGRADPPRAPRRLSLAQLSARPRSRRGDRGDPDRAGHAAGGPVRRRGGGPGDRVHRPAPHVPAPLGRVGVPGVTAEATPPPAEPRRMRLTGLHHVTAITRDLAATTAFYCDVLGLALVRQEANPDDPDARHFWFGSPEGEPGTLVSFLEYPELESTPPGSGQTHHFALAVSSDEELAAWADYLRSRGVECTGVLDRGSFRSIYLRDPDGRIVEIATT